jgi:hypothetical protein
VASPNETGETWDAGVSTAFVLGWELVSILWRGPFERAEAPPSSNELLRLDSLSPPLRARLAADLVESNLGKLSDRLIPRRIDPGKLATLRAALAEDRDSLRRAIEALHSELLLTLAVADSKLGRGYAIGHELADVCLRPNDRESFDNAFGMPVVNIKNRLSDLSSSFPPHSSRAVALSLRAWEAWAAEPELDGNRLEWERHGAAVQAALDRQGMLWRDLLAGDKRGQDMLDTSHYVKAASSLMRKMASTVWKFVSPIWWQLTALAVVVIAGIALYIAGVKAIGSVVAITGALGITGAGIRSRLGKVAGELQSQLWGAELDLAIGEAVLIGPEGWGISVDEIYVPASGAPSRVAANLRTLRQLRHFVKKGSTRRVVTLLAPEPVFEDPGGEMLEAPVEVAKWLIGGPMREEVLEEPLAIDAVGSNVLVTHLDGAAHVWRIKEERVRRWKRFEKFDEARADAHAIGRRREAEPVRAP